MGTRIDGLWEGKLVSHDPSWLSVAVIKHGDQNHLCESRAGGRQKPEGFTWSRDHRGSLLAGGLSQPVQPEFLDIPGPDSPRWHYYSLCVSSWHKLINIATLIVPFKTKYVFSKPSAGVILLPKGVKYICPHKICTWRLMLMTHNCPKHDSIRMSFLQVNQLWCIKAMAFSVKINMFSHEKS